MKQRLCYLTTSDGHTVVHNPSAVTNAQVQAMISCPRPLAGETPRRTKLRRVCYLTQKIEVNPFNKMWVAQFFSGLLGR